MHKQNTVMPPKEEEGFDVFLSHSHLDSAWVQMLAVQLEDEAKLRVWLDRWILVPGEHWQQAIARGLQQAKSCAVCIGEQTPKGWFREEIERALNRQTKDRGFRVIPVLLPNAQIINVEDFLELRTWVDFTNGIDDSTAFRILVSGIRGEPPGRDPMEKTVSVPLHTRVREKLVELREIRRERLIDDDIALEYQRRLLDILIES